MGRNSYLLWLLLLGLLFTLSFIRTRASTGDRKPYVVYMGDKPTSDIHASAVHTNMLQEVLGSDAQTSLLHTYKRSFNGFAAYLTEEEMQRMAAMEGVVTIFPSERKQLHTTRSWDFMGFPLKVNRTTVESDIIIGMFDSGIWPESDSFSDKGFGPPPGKWKGSCQSSNFTCNNKIIGARYYRNSGEFNEDDLRSARDSTGHGTHTASIAAGGVINSASLMGLGLGTARGGVPSARIAVYKVCWSDGCDDADVLAAFDDAIADGVDIISLSVGGSSARDYLNDSIAIGSFHAMKNGILTSTSAGNDGPDSFTLTNASPWSLTVAASSIDRKFLTKVRLGNNRVFEGVSVNTFDDSKQTMYPVVYGGDVPNVTANYTSYSSRYCLEDSLDKNLVKGKIVVCDETNNGETPLLSRAAGMVIREAGDLDVAYPYVLPGTRIGVDDGAEILNYINSTRRATATILKSNEVNDTLAPYVASFSSRGPNPITLDILKPDITAPGVDILAAWSLIAPVVSRATTDKRRVRYNIDSGTSMSCPHATAAAVYIKSFHPSWSPSAIKSALMTTAYPLDSVLSPQAEFAYGAGHIDPLKAVNPGLVYDANVTDYVKFLCGQGYSSRALQVVTRDASTCSKATTETVWDLNLPSFTLSAMPLKYFSRNFSRTLTNVGSPKSKYIVKITSPDALKIQVEPSVLSFTSIGQKLSFVVKVGGVIGNTRLSAALVWDDGTHQVRSPIAVYSIYRPIT